jgi:hypothetical protein
MICFIASPRHANRSDHARFKNLFQGLEKQTAVFPRGGKTAVQAGNEQA